MTAEEFLARGGGEFDFTDYACRVMEAYAAAERERADRAESKLAGAIVAAETVLEGSRKKGLRLEEACANAALLRQRADFFEQQVSALRAALRDAAHVIKGASTFASPQWRRNALSVAERAEALAMPPQPQEKKA